MKQSNDMNIHSTIAKIIDDLIRNENPLVFCFSYYNYNNEQRNHIEKIINSKPHILLLRILAYNTYFFCKSIFAKRVKINIKAKNLIFFENSKYLDVVNEISGELVKTGRDFSKVCGSDIRKDLVFFNRVIFNEIRSQISVWNSIKTQYNSDVRKVLNYIFF